MADFFFGKAKTAGARADGWMDGWSCVLVSPSLLNNLVYFGSLLPSLEAEEELMGFMESCNHPNSGTTCANIIGSLRIRCT